MKAVLRGKFMALRVQLKKLEKSYTKHLTAHLKALEEKEENTPKRRRRQNIVKLRAEINQIKRMIQRINKSSSSRKSTKCINSEPNKLMCPMTVSSKFKKQNKTKLRNEKGYITTETEEIQNIIRSYY